MLFNGVKMVYNRPAKKRNLYLVLNRYWNSYQHFHIYGILLVTNTILELHYMSNKMPKAGGYTVHTHIILNHNK